MNNEPKHSEREAAAGEKDRKRKEVADKYASDLYDAGFSTAMDQAEEAIDAAIEFINGDMPSSGVEVLCNFLDAAKSQASRASKPEGVEVVVCRECKNDEVEKHWHMAGIMQIAEDDAVEVMLESVDHTQGGVSEDDFRRAYRALLTASLAHPAPQDEAALSQPSEEGKESTIFNVSHFVVADMLREWNGIDASLAEQIALDLCVRLREHVDCRAIAEVSQPSVGCVEKGWPGKQISIEELDARYHVIGRK